MVFYICIIIIRVIEILICNSYHLHIIYFHEIFYKIVIFKKFRENKKSSLSNRGCGFWQRYVLIQFGWILFVAKGYIQGQFTQITSEVMDA